jgi:hypothetical protein
MVDTLGALLDSDDAKTAPFNRRHWLRRAT